MSTQEFKPQLVGSDKATIEKKIANWKRAISEINTIAGYWTGIFGEAMQPHHVVTITGLKEITRYLKEHFVSLSETDIARGVRTGQYEMKAALENMKFPNFESLKSAIIGYNVWLNQNNFTDELLMHLQENFNGETFGLSYFFRIKVETDHTFYTRSEAENKTIELVKDVCQSLNRLNEIGIPVNTSDLPLSVRNCFVTVPGSKTYAELQSGAGNPGWKIPKLSPYWGMFRRDDNSVLQMVEKNG